jgi:hypothetical protein
VKPRAQPRNLFLIQLPLAVQDFRDDAGGSKHVGQVLRDLGLLDFAGGGCYRLA